MPKQETVSMLTGKDLFPGDLSDSGNAELLVQAFKNRLCRLKKSKLWLVWDGTRWIEDTGKAEQMVQTLFKEGLNEASRQRVAAEQELAQYKLADPGDEEAKNSAKKLENTVAWLQKLEKHFTNSRNERKVLGALRMAHDNLSVDASALDSNPYILNTPAGVVDLRTGELSEHRPELYCTKITSASPGEEGRAEWENFLQRITRNDKEYIDYLQHLVGMALFGKVYEQGITFAIGGGGNGKSTFFSAIAEVLRKGEDGYADHANPDVFMVENRDVYAMAQFVGERIITTGELDEDEVLSPKNVKRLTSTDAVLVQKKYENNRSVDPTWTVFLFTNHLPHVEVLDTATWRRIRALPFFLEVSEDEKITNYAQVLAERCGGAILSWMIEGAVWFWQNGCKLGKAPQVCEREKEQYNRDENWLLAFVNDCCQKAPGQKVSCLTMHDAYRQWVRRTGWTRTPVNIKAFGNAMEKHGFERTDPDRSKARFWRDLYLCDLTWATEHPPANIPQTPCTKTETSS